MAFLNNNNTNNNKKMLFLASNMESFQKKRRVKIDPLILQKCSYLYDFSSLDRQPTIMC